MNGNATSEPGCEEARACRTPGLRNYQHDAVNAICGELAHGGRATTIMACGTGKSLVGLRSAEALVEVGGAVAVFAPSLALIEQLHRTWTSSARRQLRTMVVCSQDDLLSASPDDDTTAVPVSTKDADIQEFLTAPDAAGTDMTVVFCTYQSAERLANVTRSIGLTLALIVADEAHRTAGKKDGTFSIILSNNRISAHRRLFLTATRRVHTDVASDALSMDDAVLYGRRVYTYPFGKAISDGWLSDYRVAVVVITDTEVHRAVLTQASMRIAGEAFNAARAAAVLGLFAASETYGLKRVLAFHNTVSASRQFATNIRQLASLKEEGPRPDVYHLDALASATARRAALEHLATPTAGRWTVVNNVRVLAEGVDIPSLDAVMFAEPKRSQIDVVQAVGRAIRKNPDRAEPAVILVPIYIAPGESPRAVLSGSRYRHVWQVIRALRDHDELLDAELAHVRRNDYDPARPTYAPNALPEKILVTGATADADRFAAAVTTMLLDATTTSWAEGLAEYRAFTDAHGKGIEVPRRHITSSGFPLGQWQSTQRQAYRWERLSAQQVSDMEDAGFNWGQRSRQWRANVTRFTRYTYALSYPIPPQYLVYIDPPLLQWLISVQERATRGLLSPKEKADLTAADIPWSGIDPIALTNIYNAAKQKACAQFLDNIENHGAARAEAKAVTVRTGKQTRRFSGPELAKTIRFCAAHGMLSTTQTQQAQAGGMELPPLQAPVADTDAPDWQYTLLAAVARLTATSTPFEENPGGPAKLSAYAERQLHDGLSLTDLSAALTGPTIRQAGVHLTQLTAAEPSIGQIDVYATELIADVANDTEYAVGLDHTVYKRDGNHWALAGQLRHHINEIALVTTGQALAQFANQTIAANGIGLPPELQDELAKLVWQHVGSTATEFALDITKEFFGISRVRIFGPDDDVHTYQTRAWRAKRVVARTGPKFATAVNSASIGAFNLAATAAAERTLEALDINHGRRTGGGAAPGRPQ